MDSQTVHAFATRPSLPNRPQNFQDNESGKDFLDICRKLIYSAAIRSGLTETEAQEVVEETLTGVARDIHKFQPGKELGSLRGWLKNLTRGHIAGQVRKRTSRQPGDTAARQTAPEALA